MTITTREQLVKALSGDFSRLVMNKSNLNGSTGNFTSQWRTNGLPGTGALPTSAVACDHTTVGAMTFTQQTSPRTSYLAWGSISSPIAVNMGFELHDRLVHMAGLSGLVTTTQTVGLDMASFLGSTNMDARIGSSDYGDINWWAEWWTTTGGVSTVLTVNAKFNDGTDANLTPVTLAATRPVGYILLLNNLIPAAQAGKYIRGINSATLGTSTGVAGNFGFTATRHRSTMTTDLINVSKTYDWAATGLPEIYNSSCLFAITMSGSTSSGAPTGQWKLAHG